MSECKNDGQPSMPTNPVPGPKRIPRLDFRDPTLAPSRLNQLDACPGFIGAVLEQDTDAMDEGTALHAAVETAIKTNEIPEGLSPEHRDMVEWAVGFFKQIVSSQDYVSLEHEMTIPFCHNKARIDVLSTRICSNGGWHTVIDWKFGRAKQAPADRNPQMRAYAVGLMQADPNIYQVKLFLAYPRMQMHDTAIFTREDFLIALEELAVLKVKCDDYLNRLTPGEACKNCGRKLQCSALSDLSSTPVFRAPLEISAQIRPLQERVGQLETALAEAVSFLKNPLPAYPESPANEYYEADREVRDTSVVAFLGRAEMLTGATPISPSPMPLGRFDLYDPIQLGEFRRAAGVLEAFCREVKQWVDEAITKHGVEVPGFEVMERRGTRGLTDGVKALEMLPQIQVEAGLPPEVDWARLVEGLGITLPKLESYLTEVLKAAHNGKPPRGSIKELTTKLTVGLNRLGLVKEGTPTVFVQEVKS